VKVGEGFAVFGKEFLEPPRTMKLRKSRGAVNKVWGDSLVDHREVSLTSYLFKDTASNGLVVFG